MVTHPRQSQKQTDGRAERRYWGLVAVSVLVNAAFQTAASWTLLGLFIPMWAAIVQMTVLMAWGGRAAANDRSMFAKACWTSLTVFLFQYSYFYNDEVWAVSAVGFAFIAALVASWFVTGCVSRLRKSWQDGEPKPGINSHWRFAFAGVVGLLVHLCAVEPMGVPMRHTENDLESAALLAIPLVVVGVFHAFLLTLLGVRRLLRLLPTVALLQITPVFLVLVSRAGELWGLAGLVVLGMIGIAIIGPWLGYLVLQAIFAHIAARRLGADGGAAIGSVPVGADAGGDSA